MMYVTDYLALFYLNQLATLRCFEVFAILLVGFMCLRAKQAFIVLAPMFCWQNETANLDLSSSLPLFSLLQFAFHKYELYQN